MEEWRNGRLEGWECGRPSMPIKTLKAIIDLEGCGPSQPRNPTELSTLDAYLLPTRQSPLSSSTAPRDRTPSRS